MKKLFAFFCLGSFLVTQPAFAELDFYSQIAREATIIEYQKLKNPNDFIDTFFAHRPLKERAELKKRLAKLKRLPKISRTQDGILLRYNGQKTELKIISAAEHKFILGNTPFHIHPNLSYPIQIDMFMDAIKKGQKTSMLEMLLLPKAHAVAPILGAGGLLYAVGVGVGIKVGEVAVGRFANSIVGQLINAGCWVMGVDDYKSDQELCAVYIKEKNEKEKRDPNLSSLKNAHQLSEPKGDEDFFLHVIKEQCTHESKNNLYRAVVRIITTEPVDEKKKKSDPNYKPNQTEVWRKIEAEGDNPKSVKIWDAFDPGELKATITLDKDLKADWVILPNTPANNPEKVDIKSSTVAKAVKNVEDDSSATVPATFRISLTADLKDDPTNENKQIIYKKIFGRFGARQAFCKEKKANATAASKATDTKPPQKIPNATDGAK